MADLGAWRDDRRHAHDDGRFQVGADFKPPAWVRALLWGAVALGVVGLGVSAAMYWDVFTSTIKVPSAPGS